MTKKAEKPMSKGKKALNIALVVLQVAIVIVAIAFSVSILLSTGYESNTDFGKSSIRLMPVLTDSMAGDKEDSFKAGDLIIVKSAEKVDLSTLKVGDIITYLDNVGGDLQFVTHRIIDIKESEMSSGTVIREYITRGDAEDPDTAIAKTLYAGDIKGVYVGKLAGVGSAVFWLQDPTHFFLVIMLPLILLLLYNAYLVVRIIMEAKLKKQREQLIGATSEGAVILDEEEIKRRAVEEYIKKKAVEDYIKEQEQSAAKAETAENAAESAEAAPVPEQINEPSEKENKEEAQDAGNVSAEIASEEPVKVTEAQVSVETAEEKTEGEQAVAVQTAEAVQVAESESPTAEKPAEEQIVQAETAPIEEEEKTPENAVEKAEEESKPKAKKPAAKKAASAKSTAKTATKTATKTAAKTATKSAAKPAAKKTAATKSTAKSATAKTTATKTAKTAAKKTEKKS